ncbi:MAG TPA: glycosyltransferase family protein [Gemmatimonadaceae bacterium]|nr:glycosyltransferase family protein [Gemmatimonadaceae bacterium]
MKTVAIIQARTGSTRLPRKVLQDLGGSTVLARVIDRVQRFSLIHDLIVATSTHDSDDAVVEECARARVETFRGNEADVLDRFVGAANYTNADVCVRLTADCPLLDAGVSDSIISLFLEADGAVDYASNKIPQSFPRGLDTEVFSRDALDKAAREAHQQYERVHVTAYMYKHPERFNLLSVTSDVDRAEWRWTVDTAEDLEFVREIYRRLDSDGNFSWTDVVALLEDEPELMWINSHVQQKAIEAG